MAFAEQQANAASTTSATLASIELTKLHVKLPKELFQSAGYIRSFQTFTDTVVSPSDSAMFTTIASHLFKLA